MRTLEPRPYQTEAEQAVNDAWQTIKRPAVVLPTGMGKTVIFSFIIRTSIESGRRPLVLVHRDELVKQTIQKIHDAAPGARVGVVKAERHELDADVVVASVQTLGRVNRLETVPTDRFHDIIVDECHHAAADSYVRILDHFGCFEPVGTGARAVGFTATMSREDNRKLGMIWERVAYSKDILFGIMKKYLVDVRGQMITVEGLDLAEVGESKATKDYAEGDLGRALVAAKSGRKVAEGYLEYARREDGSLRPGILFAPTVEAAEHFASALAAQSIRTEVIVGTTPPEDRALSYKKLREGDLDVLASCMVLTEGFDLPEVEVAVIARPTQSRALYVQMVGRVLRPAPWTAKKDALILDVVGISGQHKLASIADLTEVEVVPEEGESLGEAVQRLLAEKKAAKDKAEQELKERLKRIDPDIQGQMKATPVDLFKRSRMNWLQTKAGCWFIPTKERTIFLWPQADGRYVICVSGSKYGLKGGTYPMGREGFELSMAMAWAADEAERMDRESDSGRIASRGASWRRSNAPATPAQIKNAWDFHRINVQGMTKSEASDVISVAAASKMIDPWFRKETAA